MTSFRASWTGPIISLLAANLVGISLSPNSALADDPARGRAQEIGSKPAGTPSERSRTAKTPMQRQMRKREGTGNFVYEIIDTIRARSEELCTNYGSADDCLEEAEVCLTMRDVDDNTVRLCLNTAPGENDREKVQKTHSRR